MEYEKTDACNNNCMFFYKDGENVMTKVDHKQLHYMPLTPRMKWLFISKKTARHMRWHKEGVRENDQVMVHPFDSEA
jgi:hypothetical protein